MKFELEGESWKALIIFLADYIEQGYEGLGEEEEPCADVEIAESLAGDLMELGMAASGNSVEIEIDALRRQVFEEVLQSAYVARPELRQVGVRLLTRYKKAKARRLSEAA